MIAVAFLLVGNVAIEHDFRNDGFGTNGVGLCHTHHYLASVIGSGSYRSCQDHHPSSQRDEKHAAHHGEQKSVSKLSANNAFCAQEERLSVNGNFSSSEKGKEMERFIALCYIQIVFLH